MSYKESVDLKDIHSKFLLLNYIKSNVQKLVCIEVDISMYEGSPPLLQKNENFTIVSNY